MRVIERTTAILTIAAFALTACTRVGPAPQPPPSHRILHVGTEQAFSKPSDAAAVVQSGDMVQISPGTYADCAVWPTRVSGVTIEGLGEVILADKTCADKAIFVIAADDVTVRGITFMHAQAASHNGAGIRAEGRNLIVERVRFVDNDEGILAASIQDSTIAVRDSYFKGNGNCLSPEGCAHGIYINHIAKLIVERSQFVEQHIGHHIKSRAALTELTGNIIEDGVGGTASYLVDIPNGGGLIMRNNWLEKGPHSENRQVAVSLAAEGNINPPAEIIIENNNFTNDLGEPTLFVRNLTTTTAKLTGNSLVGPVTALQGPGTVDAQIPMTSLP